MATSLRDELLISWIQIRVIHNLFHNPLDLFSGNIFYPYHSTLAYSDLHFVSALISAIPVALTGQAITAINFTLFSSLVLLGFAAFLIVYSLRRRFLASVLSGFLIQFSPATLDKNVHVQILSCQWMLFSVYFLLSFLRSGKDRYFLLSVAFFVVQTWNSFLPGYFTIVLIVSLFLFFIIKQRVHIASVIKRRHFYIIGIGLLFLVPVITPYLQVSHEFSYVRDIRETIHLSLQPEDLFYPNDLTRLQPMLIYLSTLKKYPDNAEMKVGYPGFVLGVLSLFLFFEFFFRRKAIPWEELGFFLAGITGFILSFGPVLHIERVTIHHPFIIPLPYFLLYYILPGFQGIRAVYRWEMLAIIAFSIGSGLTLSRILGSLPKKSGQILIFFLLCITVVEFNFPMHFTRVLQVSSFPRVYTYIHYLPKGSVIIEMPIYNWNMAPYSTKELERVYFSTYHQQYLINGASGFSPPPWQSDVRAILRSFPNVSALTYLKKLSVSYIIVHADEYNGLNRDGYMIDGVRLPAGNRVIAELQKTDRVKLLKQYGEDFVYLLR